MSRWLRSFGAFWYDFIVGDDWRGAAAVALTLAVTALLAGGKREILIDLAAVTYIDSATIGCLMDLYRQTTAAGGELRLAGVNKRVETMLTMTGAHNFLKMFPDEAGALQSFGS